jgi:hypothetical protein
MEVAEQLRTLFGSPNQSETTIDLDRQLTAIVFSFSYNNPLLEQNYWFTFTNIVNDFYRNKPDTLTPERKSQMAKIFSDNLRKDNEITRLYKIQTKAVVNLHPEKLDDYNDAYERFVDLVADARVLFKAVAPYGDANTVWVKDRTIDDTIPAKSLAKATDTQKDKPPGTAKTPFPQCHTCGRLGHTRKTCRLHGNNHANMTPLDWNKSPMGIAWKRQGKSSFDSSWTGPIPYSFNDEPVNKKSFGNASTHVFLEPEDVPDMSRGNSGADTASRDNWKKQKLSKFPTYTVSTVIQVRR